jgi:SAM-dependent methyltransferase
LAKMRNDGAVHGNWVSARIVLVPAALAMISVVLILVSPYLLIAAGVFLSVSAYFLYARWLFSPRGRNIQQRVRSLVLEHLEWDGHGEALDIGCGSAALTIELAKRYPDSTVVGIDSWGSAWGYSEQVCQRNVEEEKVATRVTFQRASASSLPFDDERFDVVVSNVVFHEVRDTSDKVSLIKEALRVLKKGGRFTFQDLFGIERYYGKPQDLARSIEAWGIRRVEYVDTSEMPFVPAALKLPFMLGTLGVLKGEK